MTDINSFAQQQRRTTSLYWAFGSNLNVRQMAYRCPTAKPIRALPVYGAKLVFRGVADVMITDNQADVALGGLWRITPQDERILDRYEGVRGRDGLYTKEYFYIRDKSRHYHSVLYYRMHSEGVFPPSENYLGSIIQGYRDFNLDLTKLEEAVRHSWDDKNKTDDMRERYLRHRDPLAHNLSEAKTPMISAKKPQRRSLSSILRSPVAEVRPSTTIPHELPKHWPNWPSVGPGSKLLPKPRAEASKAPPLESTFPQSGSSNAAAAAPAQGTLPLDADKLPHEED